MFGATTVNSRLLVMGVALGALVAGGASANTRHHAARDSGGTYAAPAQPIPYAQLDHYLHASRSERKSIEMAAANTGASTGSTANTSASTNDSSQMNAPAGPSAPAASPPENNSQSSSMPGGPVNPPATTPDNSAMTPPAANPPAGDNTQASPPATTPPSSTPQPQ